jgi:excisionase family DNA binding protein
MAINEIKRKYLTLKQLAEYSSVSVPTLRRYIRNHNLPYFQIGRSILIDPEEFDDWMKLLRKKRIAKENRFDEIVNEVVREFRIKRNVRKR